MLRRRPFGLRTLSKVLAAAAAAGGLVVLGWLPALPATAATVATTAAPGCQSSPGALAVAAATDDPVRLQQQWVLEMLNVQPAWSVTQGCDVKVAVIDSGVNPNVTDLQGSVIPNGPDYTGLTTPPSNPNWGLHGTWMASIIAGHGDGFDDGDGIIGIAPEAQILSIRVIPDTSDPNYKKYDREPEQQIQDELAHGIRTAVQDGAQVISMSIGYSAPSGAVRAALQYAYSHGAVLVASSGNAGQTNNAESFPADYPGVLSVGAVNRDMQTANFSSSNLSVQVVAPGDSVPAEGNNNLYYTVDGTSPACALVAGVAALIKSEYPKISPALVDQAIAETAKEPPGTDGYNVHTGFGIVDADAALIEAGQLLKQRPAGSQVSLAGHFGGGAAAVPAAPVAPRGPGQLVLFSVLAVISLAAAAGGLTAARRARGPRYRPGHG